LTGLPWSDGRGWRPDTYGELGFTLLAVMGVALALVFTGVDAQVEYALTQPSSYFGLSTTSTDSGEINKVVLGQEQFDGLSFTTKNRVGMDAVGSELGFCGGIRDNGNVYDLRLAEGFDELTFRSVSFSCTQPYNLLGHSQPGSGDLSAEDKSFDGEIQPEVTCIIYKELTVSPVSGEVGGINCWSVGSNGDGFTEIPVYLQA